MRGCLWGGGLQSAKTEVIGLTVGTEMAETHEGAIKNAWMIM